MSGNHRALHAQSRIQDVINARLEEISFRKGMATSASALVFLATVGLVTAELVGQGNPANGMLSTQVDGAPLSAVTTPLISASDPGSAVPSYLPRHSSHPAAGRSAPGIASGVPAQGSGTGGVQAPASAVSAPRPAGSRPGSGLWWHGGRDRDGWHRGDRGWNGWGPGGGDPWHGGRHW